MPAFCMKIGVSIGISICINMVESGDSILRAVPRVWSFALLWLSASILMDDYLPFLGSGCLILDDSSLSCHDIHDSCCGLHVLGACMSRALDHCT